MAKKIKTQHQANSGMNIPMMPVETELSTLNFQPVRKTLETCKKNELVKRITPEKYNYMEFKLNQFKIRIGTTFTALQMLLL